MITTQNTWWGVYCDNVIERFAVIINNKLLDYKNGGKSIMTIGASDLSYINDWPFPFTGKEAYEKLAEFPDHDNALTTVIDCYKQLYPVVKEGANGRWIKIRID